jgi:FdhD protein
MYGIKSFEIKKIGSKNTIITPDLVVIEEPLEIRLGYGEEQNRQQKTISVTMRTPTGHDFELALGFLFTENIIQTFDQILSIHYCTDLGKQEQQNIVRIELKPTVLLDFQRLERHFYTTSSCGICGKASIEAIQMQCPVLPKNDFRVSVDFIKSLPKILQEKQIFFPRTGGLHAALISSPLGAGGAWIFEDIGRHNALDKAIGAAFQQNLLPLSNSVLIMSSRASFELIQKAIMAGISIIVCIGSPSSLAIETAQQFGMTLIGFLRENSFNIYSGEERIKI